MRAYAIPAGSIPPAIPGPAQAKARVSRGKFKREKERDDATTPRINQAKARLIDFSFFFQNDWPTVIAADFCERELTLTEIKTSPRDVPARRAEKKFVPRARISPYVVYAYFWRILIYIYIYK